ncbi:nuclear factor 7, brain-like [Syngnathus typhle]
MASHVESSLECPACLEIFKDPVMLPCTHSMCKDCLQKCPEQKGSYSCPVCRTEFHSMDFPMNLSLRNVCEAFSLASIESKDISSFCQECLRKWSEQKGGHSCPSCRTKVNSMEIGMNLSLKNVCEAFSEASIESKDICSLHKEKLKLFCLDHQEPVCIICKDSEIHANHKFRPIDEFAKGYKEKLQEVLQDAKKSLEVSNKQRDNCNQCSEYIKVQRERVESKIKKDFEELHRFLQVEEEIRLSAVREEEKNKTQRIKKEIQALSTHMVSLSDMIKTAEELLLSDVFVMKNFQTAMSSFQLPVLSEQLPRGSLLDEAKHVGNLKFTAWKKMKEIVSYSPVILDPNTAGVRLSLSEDLTSMSAGEQKQHHQNPEWFSENLQRPQNPEWFSENLVRGSALALRTCASIWDFEVSDNTDWKLGAYWGKSSGDFFLIAFRDGEYRIFSEQSKRWYTPVKPKRIRVHLDTNKRSLSVTEFQTNTVLYRRNISNWTDSSDDMEIVPYFFTKDKNPLKILPVPHCVTIQNQ